MKANRPAAAAPFRFAIQPALAGAWLALLTSCAAPPAPVPAPPPPPAPRPSPLPARPPETTDWRDAPITSGTWRWSMEGAASVARFGLAPGDALLTLRCDRGAGTVTLERRLDTAAPGDDVSANMTITTTTLSRPVLARTVQATSGTGPAGGGALAVSLSARDPLLDAMAFSRGRFMIDAQGEPTLYVPSWTEVSRVIEDCR